MSVNAKSAQYYLGILFQMGFTNKANLTVTCGNCDTSFESKSPVMAQVGVPCPHCKEVNIVRVR